MMSPARCILAAALSLLLLACGDKQSNRNDGFGGGQAAVSGGWSEQRYSRGEDYPNVFSESGFIEMRDGVKLAYSVAFPADAQGNPVTDPLPTILTQTGYNIAFPAFPAVNEFLVKRGYVHVSVDVRGTGNSGGDWQGFGEEEQADYGEVIAWVAEQNFCNGNIGTWGGSFMAITSLFTAAHQHPAHKANFIRMPMGDAYRDIVFTGGQTNVGFIPLWMGLVTGLTLVPSAQTFDDPASALPNLLNDAINAGTQFQGPIIVDALAGTGPTAYDSDYWRVRSPLEYSDRIRTPTLAIGGLRDIFQRGQPLLYEAIKRNTEAKLIVGPWTHLTTGEGLPQNNVPDLDTLALQWFDYYLRGIDSGAPQMPDVTQYVYGAERYVTAADWPHPQAQAQRWYLREGGGLTPEMPAADEAGTMVLQLPVNGVCSSSTVQATAGLLASVPVPCFTDNTLNESTLEVSFTSTSMSEDYYINGPIQADIWLAPTMSVDAGVAVKVTVVGEDGSSTEMSNGLLSARHRAVDPDRSRYMNEEMIQVWHPFTQEAELPPPAAGEAILLNVEIFPSSFVVPAGSSLRISIGASDFPHGLPPLTDLVDQVVGVYSLLTDSEHASSVVVPRVPVLALGTE